MAVANIGTGSISLQIEIAKPPYGHVLTLDGERPLDGRLVEISHFASYTYNDDRSSQWVHVMDADGSKQYPV